MKSHTSVCAELATNLDTPILGAVPSHSAAVAADLTLAHRKKETLEAVDSTYAHARKPGFLQNKLPFLQLEMGADHRQCS